MPVIPRGVGILACHSATGQAWKPYPRSLDIFWEPPGFHLVRLNFGRQRNSLSRTLTCRGRVLVLARKREPLGTTQCEMIEPIFPIESFCQIFYNKGVHRAGVAELADALDSGSSEHYARGGSSPLTRISLWITWRSKTPCFLDFRSGCIGEDSNWDKIQP